MPRCPPLFPATSTPSGSTNLTRPHASNQIRSSPFEQRSHRSQTGHTTCEPSPAAFERHEATHRPTSSDPRAATVEPPSCGGGPRAAGPPCPFVTRKARSLEPNQATHRPSPPPSHGPEGPRSSVGSCLCDELPLSNHLVSGHDDGWPASLLDSASPHTSPHAEQPVARRPAPPDDPRTTRREKSFGRRAVTAEPPCEQPVTDMPSPQCRNAQTTHNRPCRIACRPSSTEINPRVSGRRAVTVEPPCERRSNDMTQPERQMRGCCSEAHHQPCDPSRCFHQR